MLPMLRMKVSRILNMHALDSVPGSEHKVRGRRTEEKTENLETIFSTTLWEDVLESISQQNQGLAVNMWGPTAAMKLFESLRAYLEEIRDKFSEHELKARARCPDSDYSVVNRPKM